MKALNINSLAELSNKLDGASSLLGAAFIVFAIAKLKRPVRVAHFMWCARSTCGRWLG